MGLRPASCQPAYRQLSPRSCRPFSVFSKTAPRSSATVLTHRRFQSAAGGPSWVVSFLRVRVAETIPSGTARVNEFSFAKVEALSSFLLQAHSQRSKFPCDGRAVLSHRQDFLSPALLRVLPGLSSGLQH